MAANPDESTIEELYSLHIEVLKYLLSGNPFDSIKRKFKEDFDRLNYLEIMKHSGTLSFDLDGKLIGAYPISPVITEHHIHVEGVGSGYAMCAIDALGVAFTFGAKTIIETKDRATKNSLQIIIDPDLETQTQSDILVSYKKFTSTKQSIDTPAITQCPAMNFYSSSKSVPSDPSLEIWTFDKAINYAKSRFSPSGIMQCIIVPPFN